MIAPSFEPFTISFKTPAGEVATSVDVPTSFIPVASIVPLARRLGEEAVALEEARTREAGERISCRKGCAACCRMLVPVSAPEAFALENLIESLPEARRQVLLGKLKAARTRLEEAGLFSRLWAFGQTNRPLSDEEMEPINRDYYALRMACPFLDEETCSIYEDRPAACRELLVTTPAELCDDLSQNPVQPISMPLRMSPALALLWSELKQGPPMLIPLPLALDWAKQAKNTQDVWQGGHLIEQLLNKVAVLLEQAFAQPQTERAPDNTQGALDR